MKDENPTRNQATTSTVRRLVPPVAMAVAALLVGFAAGWVCAGSASATQLERIVVMGWGDGKYGPAFYGAHVYLEPAGDGYSVRARVYLGRGNSYFHDCGELGKIRTDSEAVAKWGSLAWREDGLHIGNEPNHYFLARASLESHR